MDSSKIEITLSNRGLKRAIANEEQDFTFVVGSREYQCSRFEARFISERVCALQCNDSAVDRLEIKDIDDQEDCFALLLGVCGGESIEVPRSKISVLLELCDWLGNAELGSALVQFSIGDEPISISNCIDRLELKCRHSCDFSSEIAFIASRLSEFDIESLRGLDCGIIDDIIMSDSLRIKSEDFLLDLLLSLGHGTLIGRVKCIFLSVSGIDRLLEWISSHSIDPLLWSSLCDRLRCKVNPTGMSGLPGRFGRVYPNEGDESTGILGYLSSICGGNVHERGVVAITCSSGDDCWKVADPDWTEHWCSSGQAGSWICFDFKEKCVQLQHYRLKSKSGCYPSDWVIEGRNDGSTWTIVDEQHTDALLGSNRVETFACSISKGSDRYREFRWRMTDKGKDRPGEARCCHQAKLANVEFFGILCRNCCD
jgi:hypothetical protein